MRFKDSALVVDILWFPLSQAVGRMVMLFDIFRSRSIPVSENRNRKFYARMAFSFEYYKRSDIYSFIGGVHRPHNYCCSNALSPSSAIHRGYYML